LEEAHCYAPTLVHRKIEKKLGPLRPGNFSKDKPPLKKTFNHWAINTNPYFFFITIPDILYEFSDFIHYFPQDFKRISNFYFIHHKNLIQLAIKFCLPQTKTHNAIMIKKNFVTLGPYRAQVRLL